MFNVTKLTILFIFVWSFSGMDQAVNVGARRSFVIPMHCGKNLNVSPGDIYLVMGMHNAHWRNSDRSTTHNGHAMNNE